MPHFLEKNQVVMAIVPVDLTTAANNGDWVSLEDFNRCAVIFLKTAGTASDDPVFTLRQATDNTGAGAKALTFTRIDTKVGVQTGLAQFTTITQAAANTYVDLVSAEAQNLFVVDVMAEQLDIDNGFKFLQLQIPDTGTAASLGAALYVLHEARYNTTPLPGVIS